MSLNKPIDATTVKAVATLAGVPEAQVNTAYRELPMHVGKSCLAVVGTPEQTERFRLAADLVIGMGSISMFGPTYTKALPLGLVQAYWPRLSVEDA